MARYTLVVLTNATDGRDEQFNDWYDNQHLPDVLALEGFVAAQRFRLADLDPPQKSRHRYMALYHIEADDLAAANRALMKAAGTDAMIISDTIDTSGAIAKYFEPITDVVVATP
jgi:hypothetical protein